MTSRWSKTVWKKSERKRVSNERWWSFRCETLLNLIGNWEVNELFYPSDDISSEYTPEFNRKIPAWEWIKFSKLNFQ